MLKFNFKTIAGSDWYKGNETFGASQELGIRVVEFYPPNSAGSNGRVLANAVIRFMNGMSVYGTIYGARNGQDITFGVEQRQYQQDGATKYADINIRIPLTIQKHVLQYASTRVETVSAPVQNNVQQPVQAQATVNAGANNPFGQLTPEQFQAMVEQSQ